MRIRIGEFMAEDLESYTTWTKTLEKACRCDVDNYFNAVANSII